MSMNFTKLTTYWTPAQACDMLELLDELSDQLWETYGDQITEYRMNECTNNTSVAQKHLNLDDEPF